MGKTLSANAARAGSLERYAKLSKRLHLLADAEISKLQAAAAPCACLAGCYDCCRSMVPTTFPELVEIAELVGGWPEERKASFEERVAEYQSEAWKYWTGERLPFDATCPFLEDGLCTIYEHRPLHCRAQSSYDASLCLRARDEVQGIPGQLQVGEDLVEATIQGFREAGRAAGTYELGPSVLQLLRAEEVRLPRKYQIGAGADGEIEHRRDLMSLRLKVEKLYDQHREGPWANELSQIFGLELPVVYESEEQMEQCWDELYYGVDDLCKTRFQPAAAFQALNFSGLFYLPYSDRDVKPFLSQFMKHAHAKFAKRALPELVRPLPGPRRLGRFRLGYLSRRLTNYNGSRWALGWLAHQSPEIETFAFNLDAQEDAFSLRWRRLADHYYHAPAGAAEVAQFVRSLDLDALIFTDPGDDGSTLQLSLLRLARWQMTAWGRAITSGSPEMDFYLSSEEMEPADGDAHYVEKLIRLPGSGQYLDPEPIAPSSKSRMEIGLPDGPYYFIAQNPSKLLPTRDAIWKEISLRSGKPILICSKVSADDPGHVVYRRMLAAGVDVRLLPRLSLDDFLRTAQLAHAVLDSFDFSGGITTIQMLGSGIPVLSCPGRFMRSRMAVPFLKQSGVPDLIAKDEREFIDLACDAERIAAASASLNPSGIYRDLRPVRALEEFLLGLSLDRD